MARPFKLTDLQLALLTTAAGRSDGSLLPAPEHVSDLGAGIQKAIPPLIKHELVTETPVTDTNASWRQNGNSYFGLLITSAGRATIAAALVPKTVLPAARANSKIATVAQLLRRDAGATLDELVQVTGWLPHTTRAALTGLRKKGHAITRSGETGASRYHMAA